MKKKLTFSAALLATALMTQAGVLLQENWDFAASSPEELENTAWRVDDGNFGDGIYAPCHGEYTFGVWADGTLNFSGFHNNPGLYWAGYALMSKESFSIKEGKVLVVDARRISHTKSGGGADCATRTGLWLMHPDKAKWLLFADNYGESDWGFNPYSGTATDYPVNNPSNIGYNLSNLNSAFASILHNDVEVRIVADGQNASMYMRDPNTEGSPWVLGRTTPLHFSEDICVGLGVYTRTPAVGAGTPDRVEATFGPLSVSELNAIRFAKDQMSIAAGESNEAVIRVSADATPVTVTLASSDSSVVTLAESSLSFAKGETEKTISLNSLKSGKAVISITTGNEELLAINELAVTSAESAGIKLEDNFDGAEIDTTLWNVSDLPYETGAIFVENFGLKDGQLVAENFVATANYWGGKSLVTKSPMLGSTETALEITVDFGPLTATAGVSVAEGLILRNADGTKFFALRNCRGVTSPEYGWVYNVAKGAGGVAPAAWASFDNASSSVARTLKVVYNGSTLTPYLDGASGGTFDWVCDEPMYVELGFYAREEGAAGSGSFNYVKIENVQADPPTGSVTPATVRVFPQFKNQVKVTVPEEAISGEDLVLSVVSEDATIAVPAVSELVFAKNGEVSQMFDINFAGAGQTSIKLTPTAGATWLTIPDIAIKSYGETPVLFSDDFSGSSIDASKWAEVSRPQGGGVAKDAYWAIEEGKMGGSFEVGSPSHAVLTQQIKEAFYPTSTNPVIIEYTQYPLSGIGTTVNVLGTIVNLNTEAAVAIGRARGDVSGWNMYPGYDFGAQNKPAALQADELLDNEVPHKVRIFHNGTNAHVYVDDIYGGYMALATDCIAFGLGGEAYTTSNWVNFAFDDVKVWGVPTIAVDTEDLDISEAPADLTIVVPTAILNEGVTLSLTIDDPAVATFDTGATKSIELNSTSANVQTIAVSRVGAGATVITVANDKEFNQSGTTINVVASNAGELLFEDLFDDAEISTERWALDLKGFESGSPENAGDLTTSAGWAAEMNFTATGQYWPGAAYWAQRSFKASLADPITLVVDRNAAGHNEGATGARSAIWISNADKSKWILISQCVDSGADYGWGWNKVTGTSNDKAEGVPNTIVTPEWGRSIVKLVANGQTLAVYVDDVLGVTLDFPVDTGIRIGFGVYARAVGDSVYSAFDSVQVYGSETPAPNPPTIAFQPNDLTVAVGQPAAFTVVANGADLTYAWYKDGVALDYISSPTYTIAEASNEDAGIYTVEVSNVSGKVVSDPATLTLLQEKLFTEDFKGPELDMDLWTIDEKPFEAANPNGNGTLEYQVENGLHINFTLTENYWGGRTFFLNDLFEASVESPITFEVDREAMGYEEGTTGARSFVVISNEDGSKWVNISESQDDVGYVGWGWNKLTGAADDKAAGGANAIPAFAAFNDKGHHNIKLVANGESVDVLVDGTYGVTLDFPVSEGIRFGIGIYTRMIPDAAWTSFNSVTVWGNAPAPEYMTESVNYTGNFKGSAEPVDDTLVVKGCGADVWGTDDQFFYVYDQMDANTNFEMIVKVNSFEANSNAWAKAGLMVREADAAGKNIAAGRHFTTQVQASNQVGGSSNDYWNSWRVAVGANVSDETAVHMGAPIAWPNWQRIVCEDGVYTSYYGVDGTTWTQLGQVDTKTWADGALGSKNPLYVGLWVTSHEASSNDATAVFSNWIINEEPVPPSDLTIEATYENGELTLTWEGSAALQSSTDCVNWTPVLGAESGFKTSTTEGTLYFRLAK